MRGCYGSKKNQHPQKNASNFNKNRLGSPTSPGRLPRDDLVRVWATCPPEKVPEMDVAMSKAGEERVSTDLTWWSLIRVSRKDLHPEDGENDDHQQEVYFTNIRTSILKCNPRMNTTKRTNNLIPVEFQWWSFDRPKFWIQISVKMLLQEVQHFQKWQVLSASWWKVMVGFQIRDLVTVALFFHFSFWMSPIFKVFKPVRWWFELFLIFTPYPGEMMNFIHFDEHIFFKWVGSTTNWYNIITWQNWSKREKSRSLGAMGVILTPWLLGK